MVSRTLHESQRFLVDVQVVTHWGSLLDLDVCSVSMRVVSEVALELGEVIRDRVRVVRVELTEYLLVVRIGGEM